MAQKVLWVVDYARIDDFLATAMQIGATRVAIRTDNDIAAAVGPFGEEGIEVYGWRWPYADPANAMDEADRAARFFGAGMAGYYVDPERAPGEPWDWDRPDLASLAADFCKRVTEAAAGQPFGTTSHYLAADVYPHLPWAQFVQASNVLLPQAYWRSTRGRIGSGQPGVNYKVATEAWQKIAGNGNTVIQPMAGELGSVTSQELAEYGQAANDSGMDTLHFFSWTHSIPDEIWQQIASL